MDIPKSIPRCRMCGSTVPDGKTLCWCCEHTPKLHKDVAEKKCSDSCEIVLDKRK